VGVDILAVMKMVIQTSLLIWLGLFAASAAETRTSVRQEGTQLTVEGWVLTAAERATAWAVLTDYARFPEFVPGIYANKVLEAGNGTKTIEQRGEVVSGQFRMPYAGVMQVREHAGEGLDIQFLSGPFKDVRGEWNIEAGRPLKLTYRMQMDLMKSPFPPPLAPAIAEQQVKSWVEVFGQEMERRKAK
jgi:ribosome-associated toxin RatA of RatAB toxin-antitoxin module